LIKKTEKNGLFLACLIENVYFSTRKLFNLKKQMKMKKSLIVMLAAFIMTMVLPVRAMAGDVWISTGKGAVKYHKSKDCRAIKSLDKKIIKELSISEAQKMGRTECLFCYGGASTKSTAKKTTTKKVATKKASTTTEKKATTTAKKKVEEPKEEAKTAKKATTTTKKATTKKKTEEAADEAKKTTKKATTTTKKKASTTTKKATTKKKTMPLNGQNHNEINSAARARAAH